MVIPVNATPCMGRARLVLPILCLFAVMLAPSLSASAPMQISFGGVVDSVTAGIRGGSLALGSEVTGMVVIERSTGFLSGDPQSRSYPFAVVSFEFSIGAYVGSMSTIYAPYDNFVSINDDYGSIPSDSFLARAPVLGTAVNGFSPRVAQFALSSHDTSRLSGLAIPRASELNAFGPDEGSGFVTFGPPGTQRIDWTVTSFVVVPEPAAALLIGFALLAVRGSRQTCSAATKR